jgi:hypothetical protein
MEYSPLSVFVLMIPTFLQIFLPPVIITALFLMLLGDRLLRIFFCGRAGKYPLSARNREPNTTRGRCSGTEGQR